ncbi:MAG: hypothetical protein H0V56_09135 [Chthoniobacterales bacterium]|nr:hypothetical protein [Chthoniobacterales bacterium]
MKRGISGMWLGMTSEMLKGMMAGSKFLEEQDWVGIGQKIGAKIAKGMNIGKGLVNLHKNPDATDPASTAATEWRNGIRKKMAAALLRMHADSLVGFIPPAKRWLNRKADELDPPDSSAAEKSGYDPEAPVAVESGSGFGKLESFRSFRYPTAFDPAGAARADKMSEDFYKFFGLGGNKAELGAVGSLTSGFAGDGIAGMNKAYNQQYVNKAAQERAEQKAKAKEDDPAVALLDRIASRVDELAEGSDEE